MTGSIFQTQQYITESSAFYHNLFTVMTMSNPYEQLYRTRVHAISPVFEMKDAEEMATQMSLIYNAFGNALKDLVKLLSILYSNQKPAEKADNNSQRTVQQFPIKNKQPAKNESKYKNALSIPEKQPIIENSVKQPDFNKYMIKFNEKPQKKYPNLHEKKDFAQVKSEKINNNEKNAKPVERIEVVRGKRQREALNGYSCTMCQNFYRALGQDYLDSNGNNKLCNDCSRHRSNLPPTNFSCDFSQEFGFDD